MIAAACLIAGILLGAALSVLLRRRHSGARDDLSAVRWQRAVRASGVVHPALRELRRCYPTHDIVANHPFLSLVEPLGVRGVDAERRCRHWTVGAAMEDKRTGATGRILLWADDGDAAEKAWILRRVGYKVSVVEPACTGETLHEALAG